MPNTYVIRCSKPTAPGLAPYRKLPSPIHWNPLKEIYNYRIEADRILLIDRGVKESVVAEALKVFIDGALTLNESVTVTMEVSTKKRTTRKSRT